MTGETKRCNGCRQTLPVGSFSRRSDASDGRQFQCKSCSSRKTVAARVAAKRALMLEHSLPHSRVIESSKAAGDRYRKMARAPTDDAVEALRRAALRSGKTRGIIRPLDEED